MPGRTAFYDLVAIGAFAYLRQSTRRDGLSQ
ncbi:hypothetical protein SAMN06297251_10727 [Fulvimarina manganoxydans]|uniref:Uncharacterized protein n=1 Tax=Fulvimarina manganoxydans TaxID=937218 RepID=A0A1W2BPA4_9HYPH|nr:hypothetical protein SAMN06297251_10727 [Fulvimarina manganoxydans]